MPIGPYCSQIPVFRLGRTRPLGGAFRRSAWEDTRMTQTPALGSAVTFRDGDTTQNGIVNGEPRRYTDNGALYVPVHVPETNENMMVDSRNLVTDDA